MLRKAALQVAYERMAYSKQEMEWTRAGELEAAGEAASNMHGGPGNGMQQVDQGSGRTAGTRKPHKYDPETDMGM
jgi:hypothetical protein